ncbi:MAG: FAD:protein FMN transferase [Anaerolineae bacterium]
MTHSMVDTTQAQTYSISFRAMNCEMGAWVVATDAELAQQRLAAVEVFIHATEVSLSRFRPESELSRLNARTGETVAVSKTLADVLALALTGARETDGIYDPTILDALEAAGYDRSFEKVSDDARPPVAVAPRQVGWRDIQLDVATRRVQVPRGIRLDLGGIAKGWTADRAAGMLAQVGPCLVDAGGDIVARGQPLEWPTWPVGIADPRNADEDLALLMVSDRGIATSGTDYRRWRRGEKVQHHIIDPRTRQPAQTDLLSVTVIAPTAAHADLYAKVALILGSQAGRSLLEKTPGVEGLLINEMGEQSMTAGFAQYVYRSVEE